MSIHNCLYMRERVGDCIADMRCNCLFISFCQIYLLSLSELFSAAVKTALISDYLHLMGFCKISETDINTSKHLNIY